MLKEGCISQFANEQDRRRVMSFLTSEGRARGLRLYSVLIDALRGRGTQVVLGSIAQPNPASVALHENLGYENVAHFKRVGRSSKNGLMSATGNFNCTPCRGRAGIQFGGAAAAAAAATR